MSDYFFTLLVRCAVFALILWTLMAIFRWWWNKPLTEKQITQARESKEGWKKRALIALGIVVVAFLLMWIIDSVR